jgi:hypothetical protein
MSITHRLALDEYGIFSVFPVLIPSFRLLFVYFTPKNEERIHNNSYEEVLPHPSFTK